MKLYSKIVRRSALLAAIAMTPAMMPLGGEANAASSAPHIERQDWSFAGMLGFYDRGQLQRGYQVYKEVCASCHGMKFLHYRNLSEPGGPEFSKEAVKYLASTYEVQDGPDSEGQMYKRKGRASDAFVSPYANEQEARASNSGAFPPDLSLITKARNIHEEVPFYMAPLKIAQDIATGYQEGGADYVYAIMTGYADEPEGMELADGMSYNKYFSGHQIAMPNPLAEEVVEYTDGTAMTVENYAKDVTEFLMWAAEPKLEERKRLGFRVLFYLLTLSGLMFFVKRIVWKDIPH